MEAAGFLRLLAYCLKAARWAPETSSAALSLQNTSRGTQPGALQHSMGLGQFPTSLMHSIRHLCCAHTPDLAPEPTPEPEARKAVMGICLQQSTALLLRPFKHTEVS